MNKELYFDYAGTCPFDEDILKEALAFSTEHWGNPSSLHEAGTDAKKALDEAREECAKALGVKSENIFFTSGGTESDHLALLSVLTRPQKGSVVISAIEHPALRELAKMITNTGWKVITVKPDKNGIVQPEAVVNALEDDTALVSVMAVNNETGAVQDIYAIADALTETTKGKRRPFFHADCVQAAGKIPLNLNHPGIDSAAFSAHKIGGPRGIGILYLKKEFNSFLKGGGQEKNIRSGTENLFGAKAFALALNKYFISERNSESQKRYEQQKEWTKEFISNLMTLTNCTMIPHIRGTAEETDGMFSPWVVQASFKGIPGQVMLRALNAEGIYISTGSACSASKQSRPILDAMGISPSEKETAVRFSFGHPTSYESMQILFEKVKSVCGKFCR